MWFYNMRKRALDRDLDALLAALAEPIGQADAEHGWTEDKRRYWAGYFAELKDDLGLGKAPIDASHHLVRWLDHYTIAGGPLAGRIEKLQRRLGHFANLS